MRAPAVRARIERPHQLSPHRRGLAASGTVQAWVHEGTNGAHCVEVSTTGALGTVLLSRQNMVELARMIDAAEEAFEQLDDRGDTRFLRPPEKLVF